MFDRYELRSGPQHVSVTHTEKRAPTDESVRLLKEMENAARAKVVESMRLENSVLEAVVHRYEDDLTARTRFRIHYQINGTKREAAIDVDYHDGIEKRIKEIYAALSADLAAFLLQNFMKGIKP